MRSARLSGADFSAASPDEAGTKSKKKEEKEEERKRKKKEKERERKRKTPIVTEV